MGPEKLAVQVNVLRLDYKSSAVRHGVPGIPAQIDQDLLKLIDIAVNDTKVPGLAGLDLDHFGDGSFQYAHRLYHNMIQGYGFQNRLQLPAEG